MTPDPELENKLASKATSAASPIMMNCGHSLKAGPLRVVRTQLNNASRKTGGHPPDGPSDRGYDSYGDWLEVTVGGVTQRMRWIRPGRFLMGSPEDEPMRNDGSRHVNGHFNEGPRHEVQISKPFWLFDTPVTQALWQVVMVATRAPSSIQSVPWSE